mgnify:CR=1 FL=1
MGQVLTVVIVILSLAMIGLVLMQKSKGGGLASNFSSGNQILGVRKTTETVEKATWILVAIIVVLCVASATTNKTGAAASSEVADQVEMPATPGEME